MDAQQVRPYLFMVLCRYLHIREETYWAVRPYFLCGYVGVSLDGGDFLNCEGVTP